MTHDGKSTTAMISRDRSPAPAIQNRPSHPSWNLDFDHRRSTAMDQSDASRSLSARAMAEFWARIDD